MRLPPWLWRVCRSRWTKRFFIASPFLLIVSIIAFYGIANWYGTWALEREATAMRAAGWPVTLEEVLGPGPKPEEDLFQHPTVRRELALPEDERVQNLRYMARSGVLKGFSRATDWRSIPALGKPSDVRLLVDPPRITESEVQVAKDLLVAIENPSQRFDEMKEAFHRPRVNWEAATSQQLLPLRQWSQFVGERARIRLVSGNPSSAFEDTETMAILIGTLHRGPFLISYLVATIAERDLHEVIWEGIKRQAWNDVQLAHFQQALRATGGARHFHGIARSELAYGIQHALTVSDEFRQNPDWTSVRKNLWKGTRHWDRGQLKEAFTQSWENIRPLGSRKLEVRKAFAAFRRIGDWLVEEPADRTAEEFYAYIQGTTRDELDVTQYARSMEKYFEAEARRSLVLTGIALERYRLKHGAMPQTLDALVPEFLAEVPKDIYDGKPLRYQVLPDGAPHVWSIWPSGKDEGGMPNRDVTRNTVWTTGQIPGLTEAVYNAR